MTDIADEVHVHFPWGSLLGAMLSGEAASLDQLRKICKKESLLELITSVDPGRDFTQMEKQKIAIPNDEIVLNFLVENYRKSGFEIREYGFFDSGNWPNICSSWAAKLKISGKRQLFYLISQAI